MSVSNEAFLCIGDEIILYDEGGNVLISENPLETRACTRPETDQRLAVEALGTRIFRIEPQQSYTERRNLEQFLGGDQDLYYEGSPDELIELSVLESKASKERSQNETERRRRHGKPVLYGEVIQLYNAHFQKYLAVTGRTCKSDVSRLQVNLSKDSVGYFKITPRYRIRVDGEPVRLGDTIAIQCLRPEGYLNVSSKTLRSDVFDMEYREVYTHTRIASWTLRRHCAANAVQDNNSRTKYINSSQYVRFYHKEMEAYLEAPVLKRDKNYLRLKKHIINPLDPKESDSPLAFWELENVDGSKGSKIRWKRPVRIRHAASRAYLYIDPSNVSIDMNTHKVSFEFGLVRQPRCEENNDATLFMLVPISQPSHSGVPFGSYVRIQHVLTKCWMHASANEALGTSSPLPMRFTLAPDTLDNHQPGISGNGMPSLTAAADRYFSTSASVYPTQQSEAEANTTYHISGSQDFYYHDCFSITLVNKQLTDTFNIVNELLPHLQHFLSQDRPFVDQNSSRFPISDEELSSMTEVLRALVYFCTESKEIDPTQRVGLANEYHQALLRDIGVIEAAINIIQVPFNLAKRYEVHASLRRRSARAKQDQHRTQEDAVSIADILSGREERLQSILSLCYSLLRVFLIKSDTNTDTDELAKNQRHVLDVAGDAGIDIFIRHIPCGLGATDMLVQLVHDNSSVIESISMVKPQAVKIFTNIAIQETRKTLQRLLRATDVFETRHDYEAASALDLLSALCYTDKSGSLATYRDAIAHMLSENSSCLIQTRTNQETGGVEVLLMDDDQWRSMDTLLQQSVPAITRLLDSMLNLAYSLSIGTNARSLEAMRRCFPKAVCLQSLGHMGLPYTVRAKFCDLLKVLYIEVSPFKPVLLSDFTIQYDTLDGSNKYPTGSTGAAGSSVPEFFDHLKSWTLVFLDDKRHQFTAARDEVHFVISVLRLVYSQLRLGFFTKAEDIKRLSRALIQVLDGRTDARNEEHLKSITSDAARHWNDRFVLSEDTHPLMNTKILILEIFDLIFELRLHVRVNMLAYKWKNMENNIDDEAQRAPRSALKAIFEGTMLKQRENVLMPILKDILRYQYAPLKRIAVIVMHRIYNDSQDLFNRAQKVLLLSQPQQVFVYHGTKKRLGQIQASLTAERLGLQHLPRVESILREIIELLRGKTFDFDDKLIPFESEQEQAQQRPIYCILFKNLNAHGILVQLLTALRNLALPAGSAATVGSNMEPLDDEFSFLGVLEVCFEFLEELIREDKELQSELLLDNIDLLIDIGGYHPRLAVALSKICANNLHVSLRIREEHIKRILEQSKGLHGEYLRLLHGFVKAQGKLLKKHQDSVMKFMMDERALYIPFDTPAAIMTGPENRLDYGIALLELLAVCGQGDNTFVQSFARTIFKIQDVVNLIQHTKAPLILKTAVLRFLASIYLDNTEVLSEITPSDDESIHSLLKLAEDEITSCLQQLPDMLPQLNYVCNGLLIFLRSVFEHHLTVETTVDETLYSLCQRLVDHVVDLLSATISGQLNAGRPGLQHMLTCLDSMINIAGFRSSMDPEALRDKLKDALEKVAAMTENNNSRTRSLDPINTKFQGFVRALKAHKDVKQLMENEFKQLGSHFNLAGRESERDVKSLIDYLAMMTSVRNPEKRETYEVSTIKLLEEIPLQFIRERSEVDHWENPDRFELLEKRKVYAQNTLNRLGCTLVAQNLLSSPRRPIFEAALKLLIALLEGGNKSVQDKLEEYFYSIREERFFYSFHQRLQRGIASLKEAQSHLLRATYKINRQQFILRVDMPDHRANKIARKQQQQQQKKHRSHASSIDYSPQRKRLLGSNNSKPAALPPAVIYQKISNLMASETAEFGTANEDFESMKDTMRALQLMVEGHNLNLQTYLAKQPDNIKSFNIVQDVVEYLHAIVPLCNIQNVRLIIQVLDTVTDLAQGCIENQVTIFSNKIINPMNTILRESYTNCPSSLINELKSKVVICLLSLLEGGMDHSEVIFREMAGSLDLAAVIRNMNAIYDQNADQLNSPGVYEKLECGFQYCMLLMTLWPALDESQQTALDGNRAFEFFQRNTGKIEVVMDYNQEKQLSRVLFPIPEVCKYLREDTKQRFLWQVKRDSPSAKIEDFVRLSENIIYEIENQAKVARNPYLSMLSRHSALWWQASYGVTVLLNLQLLLSCSSSILFDEVQTEATCGQFEGIVRSVLGILHLVFWTLSTMEFYFIQLPILVNRHLSTKQPKTNIFGKSYLSTNNRFLAKIMQVDLQYILASLFERAFLYHMVMVAFSIIGLYNPAFYSLHLLDFAFRDSILQGVIASITLNVNSISRTGLLGIIVVYIHSVVAYVFFRQEFDISKGLHCATLSQCFVTVLSHGVRSGGGIGDILEPDSEEEPRGWRTAFEMSFFLLVVVFLLNAIFGIIFDTFGHLRDERSSIQQDMKNSCFICSIPAVEFQRHAKKGFENHIKHDHNIWQYLFFLVHLKNKDRTEYTGPESYVAEGLKEANYSFFPINRALCLKQNEEDDTERLEKLEDIAQQLMEKVQHLEESMEKLASNQNRSRSNSLMLSPM